MDGITQQLAEFVCATQWEDLPASARDRAKIVLLDTVASALMGVGSTETDVIAAMASAVAGTGDSPVVGREPMSPAAAAFVNGYLVTASTVCDVHRATLCHVTPEVFPPALSIAAEGRLPGRELLLAFALGLEVTTRIGLGSNYSAFRARGWHSPGVWGPFGGAAAAGKLLGLDAHQMRNAFALAGSQAAGTFAHWGTPTIKFHQSRGAFSGLVAARLADENFEGAAEILTNPDGGLYNAYSDGGNAEAVLADLGTRWELEQLSLRPWPLASSLQTVATILIDLVDNGGIRADDVATIHIGLSKTVYNMHGELPFRDRFEALLSARYVTSVILHDAACGLAQFTDERIADQKVTSFARDRVTVSIDETVEGTGAAVRVQLADGRELDRARSVPRGDATDPLSIDDVTAKMKTAAHGVLDESAAATALERLLDVESVEVVDGRLVGSRVKAAE